MNQARLSQPRVQLYRALIVVSFLLAWEFLPKIDVLAKHFAFLDPFFVSSPSRVAVVLGSMILGSHDQPAVWPYLWNTLQGTLAGTGLGIASGAAVGLVLSNSERLSQVTRVFVVAMNSMPRIALIPIIVIIFGPTSLASIVTSLVVVFFVVFFNAYEGGRSVPSPVLSTAYLMGASPRQVIVNVRLPYVLAWTFAALPNAVSFGLVAVVTADLLTGTAGMGRLLLIAVSNVNSSLTFAVVVILSVVGITLVTAADGAKRRLLHWWR